MSNGELACAREWGAHSGLDEARVAVSVPYGKELSVVDSV